MRRLLATLTLAAVVVAATDCEPGTTNAAPARAAVVTVAPDLREAARGVLHSYGYTVNTDARLTRAVRHWQRANRLPVDGIVGPATAASLGLTPAPAKRLTPPAPQAPEPPAPPAEQSVEQIIRDVWPADLADWAVAIATRESSLQPGVRNSCCWGIFQMNWGAHRAWLTADYGITDPHQLLDARTNAIVALALYRAAGPGPWKL